MFKHIYIFGFIALFGCNDGKDESYFTGKITYQYSYASDLMDVDSLSKLKPMFGEFRYDLLDYQSKFIGKDTITYYYMGNINKGIWKNEVGHYECEDYGFPTDSIISFRVYDSSQKILGHEIKVLEFQSKLFWTRYYVSKNLQIAPETYKKHTAYNLSFYGNQTDGGLILKLEHKFKNYTMFGDLSELKKHKPDFKAIEINRNEIMNACNNN